MTINELRKLIEGLPGETQVIFSFDRGESRSVKLAETSTLFTPWLAPNEDDAFPIGTRMLNLCGSENGLWYAPMLSASPHRSSRLEAPVDRRQPETAGRDRRKRSRAP